ncbi:MAG: FtsQ-type POTRA domain-containing protein [Candidatus Paceibacterota bacterium]|jgi:hypothetical protein
MKDIPTSPRIKEIRHKRRVRRIRRCVFFFVLFIGIVIGLSYLSGERHTTIDKIVVTGTHIIYQDDIEKEARIHISGKYLHLFHKNNSFIYPENKIYKNLISKFPRIEKLSITRDGQKTLHIDIVERTGKYLYCGASLPLEKEQVGENCYFVNNDGLIFDKAPYFSGNIYFKYYMALDSNITDPLAKQMLQIDDFHKLARFIDGVTYLLFKPIYIVLAPDGTYTLYLDHEVSATTPTIIFKKSDDLEVLLDNLTLAMQKKEFADEINSKYNTLLYIDLKFKNKVLYKFQ